MTQMIDMTMMVNLEDGMDHNTAMSEPLSPGPASLSESVAGAVPQSRRACEECKRYDSPLNTGRSTRLNVEQEEDEM